MLAYGVMLAVVLTRVGLLQFKWSAIWDFADDFKLNNSYGKTVLRDMRSDKTKAQEVTKMSFILSLVFGPFFIMIIIMTCLVAVMFGLTRDPFGMPLLDSHGLRLDGVHRCVAGFCGRKVSWEHCHICTYPAHSPSWCYIV
jgi:hypothetical protein